MGAYIRFLFLLCFAQGLNAAVTINGDTSGAIRTLPNSGGFVVRNQGASAISVGICNAAGSFFASTFDSGHTASPSFALETPAFDSIDAVGSTVQVSIPAGQAYFFQSNFRVRMAAGDVGLHTYGFTYHYKVGANAIQSRTLSVPLTVASGGSNSYTATGVHAPAGAYKYANGTNVAGGGITCVWDELVVGAVTPSGKVKVTGMYGNFAASAYIDPYSVLATYEQIPTPPTNGLQPAADWQVINTATPALVVGQTLTIEVNGYIVEVPLTGDVNGNFDITLDASLWEYQQRIQDGNGNDVPLPSDDMSNEPRDLTQLIPESPVNPGIDPRTDTKVDSDPTTAGNDLSVQDIYRATRGAVSDALKEGGAGPAFDRNEWLGNDSASDHAGGRAAGSAIGGVFSPLTALDLPAFTGTGTGSGVIGFATAWGTFSFQPGPESIWIRRIFLLVLLILFWMAMASIVRSGFPS